MSVQRVLSAVSVQRVLSQCICAACAECCICAVLGGPYVDFGSELFVRAADGTDNQRWLLDTSNIGWQLIRHVVDGRVLDVNGWDLNAGVGVNVNAAHSDATGQRISVEADYFTNPEDPAHAFISSSLKPIDKVADPDPILALHVPTLICRVHRARMWLGWN